MRIRIGRGLPRAAAIVALLIKGLPAAAEADPMADSLAASSIEALLNTEVSSVLKHTSGLADAPAAVTVLRREDIERLGATTLPDLLRVVPGLAVSQIDGNKWAVGARGFNGFFGSKLLVLIDGRSIYNSTFAGVFWDAHDIPLDNIARIEVIRGPQAALWGSNAVNGVINIVTRSARETQGGQVSLTSGNVEHRLVDARYGGENDTTAWRVYARSRNRGDYELHSGAAPNDTTRAERVGFRIDGNPGPSTWLVTGEAYQGRSGGAPYPEATTDDLSGYHLLGRYTQRLAGGSTLQIQSYVDHSWRKDLAVGSVLQEDVFDLDVQHSTELNASHHLTWGGGWRQYRFDSVGSAKLAFVPEGRTTAVGNLFVQDEWTLIPRELTLIGGVRAEHLPHSGTHFQPTLRATWTPLPTHTLWAASSKAIRAPNKVDTAIRYNGPIGSTVPTMPVLGNPDFVPEEVISHEIGWRARINPRLASELSLYDSRYRKLETIELLTPPPSPSLTYYNHARAHTQGIEWSLDWQAAEHWQLRGGLTLYRESLAFSQASALPGAIISFHDSFPNRQAFVRSLWDITANQRFDVTLRGVGPLSRRGAPGYATADFRWSWKYSRALEFALTGRNLGGPRHYEIADQPFFQQTIIRRELLGTVTVNF